MKHKFICLLFCIFFSPLLLAQKYQPNWESLNTRGIPAWFHQDKFGIFIHWGVYSVPAYAPVIANSGYSYAEWYWNRLKSRDLKDDTLTRNFHLKNYGSKFLYQDFEKAFHAELFDPAQWAGIFKNSGAKYVVLTSKHHEGYCLWDSPWADSSWGRPWNAVTGTPRRDLLGDLTKAVRDQGLKMGYYYSLYEWFNPLWRLDKPKYIERVMTPEFKDLVTRYKPSVIFSDGEWDLADSVWKTPELLAWLFNESPVKDEVVVNDRWGSNTRGKNHGSTYSTSEYGSGMEPGVVWEESQGIGMSYGYNRMESLSDYKTSRHLVLMLIDIVSRGGNLLLDVGPSAGGTIPVIMQQRLADMGAWLKINGEAIYDTEPWRKTRQWSAGEKPPASTASYMAAYNIEDLVSPKSAAAHIEMFFTTRGRDLYCILPQYAPSLTILGLSPSGKVAVRVLGNTAALSYRKTPNGLWVDLSRARPADLQAPLVIKLAGAISGGEQ